MAKANEPATDSAAVSPSSQADALALAEEAEAEAAEAEALAAAARARARVARLRREAQALAEAEASQAGKAAATEAIAAAETEEADVPEDETVEAEIPAEDETVEAEIPAEDESVEAEIPAEDESVEAEIAESETERHWLRIPTPSTIVKVIAILLILAFTGFSGWAAWTHHEDTQRANRTAAFEAGAKQGVVNLLSIDFKRAKEDVQRIIDSSTGEFRDDFQRRAADFAKVAEESKVVTEGKVNAAAVESMEDHSAAVLISATSRITNSAGAQDEPRVFRLRVTVTEEGGQYKMSKVEFVP
jgi:Mce-associated membrane protein